MMTSAQSGERIVGIVAKPSQPRALETTATLIEWLQQKNILFIVDSDSAPLLSGVELSNEQILPRERIPERCSLIIVLGGDGTLISVARFPARATPVVLGVNMGTLGFLTEIAADELYPTLMAVLDGQARLSRRYLLEGRVERAGESPELFYAVNDFVVSKEALARIFGVEIAVDGEPAAHLRGDGLIISSPCGSTAYSLAAGGAIVHPLVSALLLTPICPHSLTSRPLVVPGAALVELTVSPEAGRDGTSVYLTIDGQQGMALSGGDKVTVRTSEFGVDFVSAPTRNYYQLLGAKLKWATK